MPYVKVWLQDSLRGWIDLTDHVLPESISITDSLKIKADALSFEAAIEGSQEKRPIALNRVLVQWIDPNVSPWEEGVERIFAGVIISVTQRIINPNAFAYGVEATGWEKFFDRLLVNEKYVGELAHNIVKDIVIRYSPEFTVQNVRESVVELSETFDHIAPSSCLDTLAEKIGWQWYIDFDKDVHFFPEEDNKATPLLAMDNVLDADDDHYSYGDLEITEDASEIKNWLIVKDAKVKSLVFYDDRFDDRRKPSGSFAVEPFVPTQVTKTNIASYITGILYDIATGFPIGDSSNLILWIEYVDGEPGDGRGDRRTVFINLTARSFRMSDLLFEEWIANNWEIRWNYYEAIDPPQPFVDPPSISIIRAREGGTSPGIYQYLLSEPAIYSEEGEELDLAARRVQERYGKPLIRGSFTSLKHGWKAGQYFLLYSKKRGIELIPVTPSGFPGMEATLFRWSARTSVYIQTVTTRVLSEGLLESTVEFSNTLYD